MHSQDIILQHNKLSKSPPNQHSIPHCRRLIIHQLAAQLASPPTPAEPSPCRPQAISTRRTFAIAPDAPLLAIPSPHGFAGAARLFDNSSPRRIPVRSASAGSFPPPHSRALPEILHLLIPVEARHIQFQRLNDRRRRVVLDEFHPVFTQSGQGRKVCSCRV